MRKEDLVRKIEDYFNQELLDEWNVLSGRNVLWGRNVLSGRNVLTGKLVKIGDLTQPVEIERNLEIPSPNTWKIWYNLPIFLSFKQIKWDLWTNMRTTIEHIHHILTCFGIPRQDRRKYQWWWLDCQRPKKIWFSDKGWIPPMVSSMLNPPMTWVDQPLMTPSGYPTHAEPPPKVRLGSAPGVGWLPAILARCRGTLVDIVMALSWGNMKKRCGLGMQFLSVNSPLSLWKVMKSRQGLFLLYDPPLLLVQLLPGLKSTGTARYLGYAHQWGNNRPWGGGQKNLTQSPFFRSPVHRFTGSPILLHEHASECQENHHETVTSVEFPGSHVWLAKVTTLTFNMKPKTRPYPPVKFIGRPSLGPLFFNLIFVHNTRGE